MHELNQLVSLLDENLQHAGVKGMRWGVRKDRPSSSNSPKGELKAEKKARKLQVKLEKKDAKWLKKKRMETHINTWNDANKAINPWLNEHNKKKEFKDVDDFFGDSPAAKKYIREYEAKVTQELNNSAKRLAVSPSGNKRLEYTFNLVEGPVSKVVDVKRDSIRQSESIEYEVVEYETTVPKRYFVKMGGIGWGVDEEEVETLKNELEQTGHNPKLEDILQHVGVKGMRWGVRKDRRGSSKGKKQATSAKGGSKDEPNKTKEPGFFKSRANSAKREKDWEKVINKFDKMDDKEIIAVSKRINLENDFKRLAYKKARVGTNPLKTKIGSKEDKRAYLNRDKMSDQELSRVVTRLRAKDAIVTGANKATAEQRERGMKIVNVAAPLILKAAMGKQINVLDVIDAASNYNNKSALNTVASKAGQELVGATMAKAAARAAR